MSYENEYGNENDTLKENGSYCSITPSNVLVWGILGLSFACTPFLNFLGIIFSVVAKRKSNAYAAANGPLYGQAKVGHILATVGLIVGIILTVIFGIYFMIACAACVSALGSYSSYRYY